MASNINGMLNARMSEIKSRINGRISTINSTVGSDFKLFLDHAIEENSQNATTGASNISNTSNTLTSSGLQSSRAQSLINPTNLNSASSLKSNYDNIIEQTAAKYSVSENLIKAVIKAESGFNPNAVSSCGAEGLMQLMPATASGMRVTNPFDPEQNIDAGVRFLKGQIDRFGGNVKMALAAYNCGPNRVKSLNITNLDDPVQFARLPKETQNYINKIYNYMNA